MWAGGIGAEGEGRAGRQAQEGTACGSHLSQPHLQLPSRTPGVFQLPLAA